MSSGPSPRRRWLAGGLVVAAVIVAAIVVVVVLSSGGASSTQSASTPSPGASSARHPVRSTTVVPSSVTVAVLNGTTTTGLAHQVAQKLATLGYKQGTITTATDQTRTVTIVAYRPGFRRDAAAVARGIGVQASQVQPADAATEAIACPPPGPCTSGVIVTVGSDLAAIH